MKHKISGYKIVVAAFATALSLQVSGCSNDPAAAVIGTYIKVRSSTETVELNLKSNNDFVMKTIRSGGDPTTILAGKYKFDVDKVTLESVTHINGHDVSGTPDERDYSQALSAIPLNLSGSKLMSTGGDFEKK